MVLCVHLLCQKGEEFAGNDLNLWAFGSTFRDKKEQMTNLC